MRHSVARKLFVADSGTAFSEAFSLEVANAIRADFTNFAAGTVGVFVEVGNDLDGWTEVAGALGIAVGPGYGTVKAIGLAAQYVRLRIEAGGGSVIIGAGIRMSSQ